MSAGINYAIQTYENYQTGLSLSEAASFSNIDRKELFVAGAGGFVAGLTMGVASGAIAAAGAYVGLAEGVTSVASGIIGGGLSNVAAGQTEALTSAAIDQLSENTTLTFTPEGRGIVQFSPDWNEFRSDASSYGFGNQSKITYDAISGSVIGGLGTGLKAACVDAGTPNFLYLNRNSAPWIRPATQSVDILMEYFHQRDKK